MKRNILSFDAETNGLYGKPFAVAGIVLAENGTEIARFVGRCPIEKEDWEKEVVINSWVAENVMPQMAGIPEKYGSYKDLLAAFVDFYMAHKEGADVIVHMGVPVEARLFLDARKMDLIGDFDGPFPLIDIAAFPEIGTSVDSYNAKHWITPDPAEFEGGTHNPLYDSVAALNAYKHWVREYLQSWQI